ncbi:MAG: hypothetical protein PUD51_11055 [Prevotellaceae bacterium]|nr:hypothetical protein [Prevotellaceae bacterium]
MMEKEIKEKWNEVLDYATQHATKKGLHTGIKWLEDSFNEYIEMSEKTPGYGIGGQPGSRHNREVLAQRIVLALGPFVGGRHILDEEQLGKLKDSLRDIANNVEKCNQIKI